MTAPTAVDHPFHLAIPVRDLKDARRFYGELLGCAEGRSADSWVDFNLYGHQLVCHLAEAAGRRDYSAVDGAQVPVPHFGVVLTLEEWRRLADRLTEAGVDFAIDPGIRFEGQPGEQATLFFFDPSGNALEFKALTRGNGALFDRG